MIQREDVGRKNGTLQSVEDLILDETNLFSQLLKYKLLFAEKLSVLKKKGQCIGDRGLID
jgi:hypothetical protein